jgi:hypothetical protein
MYAALISPSDLPVPRPGYSFKIPDVLVGIRSS